MLPRLVLRAAVFLLPLSPILGADWPQWRGPLRNGVAPGSPPLLDAWPAGGPRELWKSEPIPSNDEGGLSSPVAAGGRVYLSVVWHTDVPSETRQIDELVLRQLGHQHTGALGKELVAKMEATRESLSPQLRGKKLDEFTDQWIAQNLDAKQQQLFRGFVAGRFRKGKLALPLDILDALDANKKQVFASEAEMKAWLEAKGWSEEIRQQIIAAVPPTRRVAEDVVLCLDLATGATLWKAKAPGEPTGRGSSSTPCVADGKVFALGSTHAYCIDAATGRQLWAAPLAQKGPGSSPLVADGVLVVNAKHLTGYDAATGRELWRQEKAGGGNSSPVAWSHGGRTFAICNGRAELHAVDIRTGEIAWSAPGSGDSTPAIAGDVLAVQSRKGDLGLVAYRLAPTRAERLWSFPLDALRTQSSPVIHDGHVYLSDDDMHFCFDAATGSQRWRERVPATISSPALADGKLFVLLNNGNNIALVRPDPAGRVELARANVRAAWVPSPAVADGRLLLRMKDGVKCFDVARPKESSNAAAAPALSLARDGHWLVLRGAHLPGGELRINYLEAYCRAGSTDADWVKHTMLSHRSELVSAAPDGAEIRLRDTLADGVTVDHVITARGDEIDFRLTAHNPGSQRSEAHWAQPCVRLGAFTGFPEPPKDSPTDYLGKCFVFIGGELRRMPFEPWAKEARYTPGQVWRPAHVPATDVNPRPLSSLTPSHGLIGCFSADERLVFATAWEPYQELFQGVARCLHSDFRLGGLQPGETKQIRGKIYVVPADVPALLRRYERDFPEHVTK